MNPLFTFALGFLSALGLLFAAVVVAASGYRKGRGE